MNSAVTPKKLDTYCKHWKDNQDFVDSCMQELPGFDCSLSEQNITYNNLLNAHSTKE